MRVRSRPSLRHMVEESQTAQTVAHEPIIDFLPLPEIGHIKPAIAVARALRERGARTRFWALPSIEGALHERGETVLELGSFVKARNDIWAERRELIASTLDGRFSQFVREHRPSLLVADVILGPLLLACRPLGVPGVCLSCTLPDEVDFATLTPFSTFEPAHAVPAHLRKFVKYLVLKLVAARRRWRDFEGLVSAARRLAAEQGLPRDFLKPGGFTALLRMPLPNFVACSEAFDYAGRRRANVRYLGPTCIDESVELGNEYPSSPAKLVLCSFGSMTHRYKDYPFLVELLLRIAARRSDLSFIVSLKDDLRSRFTEVPGNVRLQAWIPQRALLKRASVAMIHGGLSSVKECILEEVPMAVFPQGFDQFGNASRVAYFGLGKRCTIKGMSEGGLERLLDGLIADQAVRGKLRSMRAKFDADVLRDTVGGILEAARAGLTTQN
jgi:zeaxanthin glucosyltransferase